MLTIKNIYKTKHFRTCHVPYSLCILWLLLLLLMMCWMWLTEMNQFYITILALVHHHLNNFKMFTSTSLRDYHLCHTNFRDGPIPIPQHIIIVFPPHFAYHVQFKKIFLYYFMGNHLHSLISQIKVSNEIKLTQHY